jgi:hypothetical protein
MENVGIKETKELHAMVEALMLTLMRNFKDGAQVSDALAIGTEMLGDVEIYKAGIEGLKNLPEEAKDYSPEEIMEMGNLLIASIAKAYAVFK